MPNPEFGNFFHRNFTDCHRANLIVVIISCREKKVKLSEPEGPPTPLPEGREVGAKKQHPRYFCPFGSLRRGWSECFGLASDELLIRIAVSDAFCTLVLPSLNTLPHCICTASPAETIHESAILACAPALPLNGPAPPKTVEAPATRLECPRVAAVVVRYPYGTKQDKEKPVAGWRFSVLSFLKGLI